VVNATDIAMLIAGEVAGLNPGAEIHRYRVDPPVLEWLRDGAGIPFEAWTLFFAPAERRAVSYDPELKLFHVAVGGIVEASHSRLSMAVL
jgi:hypothetical protein